jgi:hypothetical protein
MARENQGLQIALIVFVALTIILGVTTFLFFNSYSDAKARAEKNADDAREASDGLRTSTTRYDDLKKKVGFAETDDPSAIDKLFQEDMQTYASAYPAENRTYREVLAQQAATIREHADKYDVLLAQKNDLDSRYGVREANTLPKIQQEEAAAKQANDDKIAELNKFAEQRRQITADQAQLAKQLDDARKKSAADLKILSDQLDGAGEKMDALVKVVGSQREKIDGLVKETFEVPDGTVRWVNQGTGTVWIDLGRADSLSRQVTFAVYPADMTNLTKAGKKASVEVTQIMGEHLAEARILEDEITDPIMPGDKIHTPVWSPGEKKHFALAGFFDVDEDGRSDHELIRNLITMNGGVVDCEVDPNGGDVVGTMTTDTRYLVLGQAPEAPGTVNSVDAYTKMMKQADLLGVQKITLGELLQRMGWKNQTPTRHYGLGANPANFAPRPPEGMPRVSSGTVTELFRPRTPPRPGTGGGAY